MIIYKDIVTGDEMISDAYSMTLVNDVVYEVDCKMITVRKGTDVDIGANASTEEAAEELEDGQEVVNDVIHSFRLTQTGFDRDAYLVYLRGYMAEVTKKLTEKGASTEEVETFKSRAKEFAGSNFTKKEFRKWDFYVGESMSVDGMVVLLNFRPDNETRYMVFWKHGLEEVKV